MTTAWQKAEDGVRRYLQEWFDQKFSKKKLVVHTKDRQIEHEFDAVSADERIVAEVKNLRHPEYPQQIQQTLEDIALLHFVSADKKLLFLTDTIFYIVFCRAHRDDLLSWKKMGIEVVSPFELSGYLKE